MARFITSRKFKELNIQKHPHGKFVINTFIWILILVPFLSIIAQKFFSIEATFLFLIYSVTIILGIFFTLASKKISIPNFLWFLLPYFFYKFFIDFNYNQETHGSFYLTFRKDFFILATFFSLILIFSNNITTTYSKILQKYLIIVIIAAPVITILQVYNPFFLRIDYLSLSDATDSLYYIRRYSFFGFEDPNALGLTFVPLAFSFINIRFLQNKKKLLFVYLSCIGIVLILSNTRYVMAGFVLILIEIILVSKYRLKTSLLYLVLFVSAIILFFYLFSFLGYNFFDFYKDRLSDQGNIDARLASANAFWHIFPKYLFFGIGDEKAPIILRELHGQSPFIHVGFLNHLVVYGLFGSILLFGFWFGLFKRLFERARKTHYWAGFFSFLFFLWANVSLVMYSIFFSGFLLSLILEKYYVKSILEKRGSKSNLFFNKFVKPGFSKYNSKITH
jgi:hypothetical protein